MRQDTTTPDVLRAAAIGRALMVATRPTAGRHSRSGAGCRQKGADGTRTVGVEGVVGEGTVLAPSA